MIRKTVIVTGGAGDIGGAIAREFAKNGYNIALTYFKSQTATIEKEIRALGVEAKAFFLDQRDEKCVEKCFRDIFASFDYVDALVANSGIAEKSGLLIDKDVSEIDNVLSTNLRGTILVNREVMKYFLKQKHGAIVNISSILGVSGGACESVYAASKAGIIGLTKSLADECAPYVRVNALAPGFIDTRMCKTYGQSAMADIKEKTPLGRLGAPDDVASAAYFLASNNSSFITGECLNVSGGIYKF